MINFGDKIKELRLAKGLSEEDAATKLRLTTETVYSWEAGTSLPDMEQLLALSKLYDCPAEELMKLPRKIPQKKKKNWKKILITDAVFLILLILALTFLKSHSGGTVLNEETAPTSVVELQ